MTAEEEFEKWWKSEIKYSYYSDETKINMKTAYLAATKATAQRCADICNESARYKTDNVHGRDLNVAIIRCANAIKEEFGLLTST